MGSGGRRNGNRLKYRDGRSIGTGTGGRRKAYVKQEWKQGKAEVEKGEIRRMDGWMEVTIKWMKKGENKIRGKSHLPKQRLFYHNHIRSLSFFSSLYTIRTDDNCIRVKELSLPILISHQTIYSNRKVCACCSTDDLKMLNWHPCVASRGCQISKTLGKNEGERTETRGKEEGRGQGGEGVVECRGDREDAEERGGEKT